MTPKYEKIIQKEKSYTSPSAQKISRGELAYLKQWQVEKVTTTFFLIITTAGYN